MTLYFINDRCNTFNNSLADYQTETNRKLSKCQVLPHFMFEKAVKIYRLNNRKQNLFSGKQTAMSYPKINDLSFNVQVNYGGLPKPELLKLLVTSRKVNFAGSGKVCMRIY